MTNSRIAPLRSHRRSARPRPAVFLVLLLLLLAAAIYFFSTQAREVPTRPVEVDVTNAAGR